MSRRSIENVRLIYWEALSKMPIIRWVFFLCGGIPIKILGSTSLQEGDNKYCKESGACVCRNVLSLRARVPCILMRACVCACF